RALASFLDWMDRELKWHTASSNDAVAHTLHQFDMDPVAGAEVGARLGNADDWLATLQFTLGEAIVQVAFEIEGRHVGIGWIVEPVLRTQLQFGFSGLAHRVVPSLLFVVQIPIERENTHVYPFIVRCSESSFNFLYKIQITQFGLAGDEGIE